MRAWRSFLVGLLGLWALVATGFAAPDTGTPREKAEAFFETVIRGDAARAFDTLLVGSGLVATRPNAPYSLRNQLQTSLATYGKPLGYDLVEQKNFGTSLVRLVYILRLEKYPLTWEFFFYDNGTTLLPIDVHFNDRLDVYRYDRVPTVNNNNVVSVPSS